MCIEGKQLSSEELAEKIRKITYNSDGSYKSEVSLDYDDIMTKDNPTGTGSVSINRKASTAIGNNSVAMGSLTTASGDYSAAFGVSTTSSGYGAFATGQDTKATNHYAVALGNQTEASGQYSFATGAGSKATKTAASALGYSNTASGNYSFATGTSSTASGEGAQAMGYSASAAGKYSLAVGEDTNTTSAAQGSFAEGYRTTAAGKYQHVQGKYNIQDANNVYAHIVGNGKKSVLPSSDKPSNAHTLDWDGNAWFAGDVYVGSTSGTNKDDGSVKLAKEILANKTTAGLSKLYVTNDCDNYTSDDGGCTPAAVKKAVNKFSLKAGGEVSGGHIYLTGAKSSSSTGNTTQLIFGTSSDEHVAITSNTNMIVINPDSKSTNNQILLNLNASSQFPKGITGNLTGTASRATADANGKVITSTYMTKTNPTGTGALSFNGNAWFAGDVYVGSTSGTNKDEGSKKLATEDYVTAAIGNAIAASY